MNTQNQIYAVDAFITTNKLNNEKGTLLIYAPNTEFAQNKIRIYQQIHQMQINYKLQPLLLNIYFQRHCDERFIEPIKLLATQLSDEDYLTVFYPNNYTQQHKSTVPCLNKLQEKIDFFSNSHFFEVNSIPKAIIPLLWQENSRCYALINAETSFWFPRYFLNDNALKSACLYKGEQAKLKKNIAPYLVQLPLEHTFTQQLFSIAAPNREDTFNHWNKNTGVFFRSSAPFDRILDHFRRFVFMHTYEEKLVYFRFYDPLVLEDYFDRLLYYPEKLATFFGGNLIEAFLIPNKENFIYYEPAVDLSQYKQAKKQLDKFEVDEIRENHNKQLLSDLIENMISSTPELLNHYDKEIINKAVLHSYETCQKTKIDQSFNVGYLALISLAYGTVFNILDPEGKINQILLSQNKNEQEKLYEINKRADILEQQGIIKNKLRENTNA
ncbi:DUF4123 domain-containing protein [Rodentibacter myodis]|uniref:DUF4123 domain-containing protein n=1 Tax=Rodentibacter myodis TaxID=1907939 RepID=A0A1V3JN80_9PAST|nr:DUF4123 domain-containing protein [Rodentibacter myodis]OOF58270.1 hypothetical protein BKL49_07610 [Rodentibacter myodis]